MSLSKFTLALLSAGLVACGGSSSSSSGSGGGTPPPSGPIEEGRLIDSPVKGVSYISGSSLSGFTSLNGDFRYRRGDEVSFRVGSLELGRAPGAAIVTLVDLVDGARAALNSGSTIDEVLDTYPAVLNLARLLQSLDVDQDSGNGIQIPVEAIQKAGTYSSSIDFDDEQMFASNDKPAVKFVCEVKVARGLPACNVDNMVDEGAARGEVKATEEDRRSGSINELPSVSAGPDLVSTEGGEVVLEGSAQDSDGTIASTLWQQTDRNGVPINGNIEISNADTLTARFTAPEVDQERLFYFSLSATDNDDGRGSDTLAVRVRDSASVGNLPPEASAGPDQTVNAGDAVVLDGSTSRDPEGQTLSYRWQQVDANGEVMAEGISLQDADTAKASFTAPSVEAVSQYYFTLTVTDSESASDSDELTVTVNPVNTPPDNQAPMASAGEDQNVLSGDSVSLDGSASSDPDGDSLTYLWTQTAGTSVELSNANTAIASFTAPALSESETLSFSLQLSDGELSASDSVDVVVSPVPTSCDPTDPGTYEQCFSDCSDGNAETACPLPFEDLAPDLDQLAQVAELLANCADRDPATPCLLPIEGEPGIPAPLEELLGQLCEDVSDLAQCLSTGAEQLCQTFDPNGSLPLCSSSGGDPGLPLDPEALLGELCSDFSDPSQCLANGQQAFCNTFDEAGASPLCGGDGGGGGEPGELPLNPEEFLGALCGGSLEPEACLARGQQAFCSNVEPAANTSLCGGGEPGELPLNPEEFLGALCGGSLEPEACLARGQQAFCSTFDEAGATPLCGGGGGGEPGELPLNPEEFLGALCAGSLEPEACLARGQQAFCSNVEPAANTSLCGSGEPGELPLNPEELFGALCGGSLEPETCLASGQQAFCNTFDEAGASPLCGGDGGSELPLDPDALLGALCTDPATVDPAQCLADGASALCGTFDPDGTSPFCSDAGQPSFPSLP